MIQSGVRLIGCTILKNCEVHDNVPHGPVYPNCNPSHGQQPGSNFQIYRKP